MTAPGIEWAASWSQAVTDTAVAGISSTDATIRITVTGSISGTQLRLHLSNRFGGHPFTLGRAMVRLEDRALPALFDGQQSVVIAAGGEVKSDAIVTDVAAGSSIVIDLYLPDTQGLTTGNISVSSWTRTAGDHCGTEDLLAGETPSMPHPRGGTLPAPTPLLREIDVRVASPVPVVVCLGDSITAAGWPERTAERVRAASISVVNRGIAGNRLRFDGSGPMGGFFGEAGQDRFDRDVLDTAGRSHVVVALGTNDLGHPGGTAPASELPTFEELVHALDDLARRSRADGLGVIFATVLPFLPADGYDAAREGIRVAVNEWMRQLENVPVIDFDAALRDEIELTRLAPAYDSGDHVHPSPEGLDRMADEAARVIAAAVRGRARGRA